MKAREVRDALGVTQMTIHNYVTRGVLHPTVVNKRHYEYDRDEVLALVGKRKKTTSVRSNLRQGFPAETKSGLAVAELKVIRLRTP